MNNINNQVIAIFTYFFLPNKTHNASANREEEVYLKGGFPEQLKNSDQTDGRQEKGVSGLF